MNKPKYWKSIDELKQTPEYLEEARKEFPTDIPMSQTLENVKDEDLNLSANRRDFMKMLGFGITAATLSACVEGPVKKAIPYVEKPQDIIPGVANWYSSTTPGGIPVMVKTREGRPIKLEGNPDSRLTNGGLDAIGQATVLSLYDQARAKAPKSGGSLTDWGAIDTDMAKAMADIKANGGKVRVLSGTILSPSTKALFGEFLGEFEDGQHVTYDALSASALAKAHESGFGTRAIPSYQFDKAKVIASFACDFLGTWVSPVEFSSQYTKGRNPDGAWMSRHFQVESLLSLTGANADMRATIQPSNMGKALTSLYNKVARKTGKGELPGGSSFNVGGNLLDKIADELAAARGESLVVCGSNDANHQMLVAGINEMLGNYGSTLDIANPSHMKQGDDEAMAALVQEIKGGGVDAVFIYNCNPVYDHAMGADLAAALKNVAVSVSFSNTDDETSKACKYHTPDHHYLESWGDAQQTATNFSLVQPTIHPIFDTRQAQDSVLKWMGSDQDFYGYMRGQWEGLIISPLEEDWDETLRKGLYSMPASTEVAVFNAEGIPAAASAAQSGGGSEDQFELITYAKVGIGDGTYANNPWLQEMPDPISRVTWDDYVTIPFAYAEANGIKHGDKISISGAGAEDITLPAYVQTGQAAGTIGIALGYGRDGEAAGKVAAKVGGVNAYTLNNGAKVSISKTGGKYPLALAQEHDYTYDKSLVGVMKSFGMEEDADRTEEIIKETVLPLYKSAPDAENDYRESQSKYKDKKKHLLSLWESHFDDPATMRRIHWAMAIDLNKCTGCGACVVSCQAENNVPVVGKQEVMDRRAMHWMRIDRYYSGNPENPDTVFQPMMCQHCDNAPCETVCPVLATIHSDEGLNQMAYNRCVGTRYCANNCPYKVRRFNWFNYTNGEQFTDINPAHNDLGRLVLNPDVTVRFRGVMEKCSFCVQRLQEAKLRAKVNQGSSLVKPEPNFRGYTACQQSCPTGAIVFGDRNDPESEISKLWSEDNERKYLALEEVKTLSSVAYLTKVRNRTEAEYEEIKEEKHNEIYS
ncbi:MAG: TAT-variant-translocated molybdopterin oxidoreductase [Bacteroidia bacterium]|nr:TAT-variant-translocated molybdopterin oxidoreductase [Bacteroidia bacterium]